MDRSDAEKSKALEAALSQIERAHGKGSIMKLGDGSAPVDIDAVSTGSIGLDIALGIGGVPRGRIVEIYGPESWVRRRWRSISSPRPKRRAEPARLSMPSTRSTRSMLTSLTSTSKNC